jgi:general stress protein YciG
MKKKKSKKGFAAMDPEKRRAIASKGGRHAQRSGKAHRWDEAEAVEAGRKGGMEAQKRRTGNRFDSESGKEAVKKRKRARDG